MVAESALTQISLYLLYILLPILALYMGYLIVTKAFTDMGFTSAEAIIIVFVSFLLGSGILDGLGNIRFSNIPLFNHGNWQVGINIGGAVIPIVLSIYLTVKNKLPLLKITLGISAVTVITFFVTSPEPAKGIVSAFPFWLLPIIAASVLSIFLMWKKKRVAAPFAYICGTMGVLIGADVIHLYTLLQMNIPTSRNAVIGGANVFDMVFITGLLAVVLDGIVIHQQKKKRASG